MELNSGKCLPLGHVVATPRALAILPPQDVAAALRRHRVGDWGDVDPEDWMTNDQAYACGFRILSVFRSHNDVRFWIITEADRSATTVLLPDDY